METLEHYRDMIEAILDQYTQIPYAYGDVHTEAVFDRINDRYLLVNDCDACARAVWAITCATRLIPGCRPDFRVRRLCRPLCHTRDQWYNAVRRSTATA